jgi:hypothetical chaperone protein
MRMFVGIDFGTSNTSAAVYNGKEIVYIPLDPFNKEDVNILNSMLYISSKGDRLYGQKAISAYIDQMAGRSIKFERQDYGDIEMTFADMTHIAKGYYMVEKDLPGRLFQYLKKYVSSDFDTNVFGTFYKPYELVGLILKYIKTTTEQYVQQEIDGVVLGRPVKFSDDEEKNREAARNLRAACHLAGFKDVEFQYEPVAAAFNYSLTANNTENILIFDFGGGTFDVTIVNIQDKRSKVLGLGGVPVGGSDFDKSLMYEKIAPHFGKGCQVDDNRIVPNNTYLELLNWQTIVNLNRDRRFLKNLRNWIFYAEDPKPFKALQRLVKENHGFAIFQEIENTKKRLSSESQATVTYTAQELFKGEGAIDIHQTISRNEFQDMLVESSEKVFNSIDDTMKTANLTDQHIHRVIRVGGSSKIPFFHDMLIQKFGQEKLLMKDEFKNVAAGLAIEAFHKPNP